MLDYIVRIKRIAHQIPKFALDFDIICKLFLDCALNALEISIPEFILLTRYLRLRQEGVHILGPLWCLHGMSNFNSVDEILHNRLLLVHVLDLNLEDFNIKCTLRLTEVGLKCLISDCSLFEIFICRSIWYITTWLHLSSVN